MLTSKVSKIALIISFIGHGLLLGFPKLNMGFSEYKKTEEISVRIEIEKPPLLPKIDVMGKEKKLKEIKAEPQLPEPTPLLPLQQNKVVEEPMLKPDENITREIILEATNKKEKPPIEKIEVINPDQQAMFRYQDMVKQRIEQARRYPLWAKKQGFEGVVSLKFAILSNGTIEGTRILSSSGYETLDQAAVQAIKRVGRFPPIPDRMNTTQIQMEVAIVFKLK